MARMKGYEGYACFYNMIAVMLRMRLAIKHNPKLGCYIRVHADELAKTHPKSDMAFRIAKSCISPKGKFSDRVFLDILGESTGEIDEILEKRRGV